MSVPPNRLAALLAAKAAAKAAATSAPTVPTIIEAAPSAVQFQGNIQLNEKQLEFVSTAGSCVLIGAAGTGKTTSTKGKVQHLIQSGKAGVLAPFGHKFLIPGTPGIVCVSFTRRAVSNIRRAMPVEMQGNCITIHKLLEYEPIVEEMYDETTGRDVRKFRFEATRTEHNPLHESVRYIIIDESSMVSTQLFAEMQAAAPKAVFIFLGDINQLPPVFGAAVLGFRMLDCPVIELTHVYRQALESPIIKLATDIRQGKTLMVEENQVIETSQGKLTLHPWKKSLSADNACLAVAKFFATAIDNNAYDTENDVILIPYNKAFGTLELNKHIAQHLARKRNAIVHEVIAGFNKHYFSVCDKVLVDKEDGVITAIVPSNIYTGKPYHPPSASLDYWGYDSERNEQHTSYAIADIDVDELLDSLAADDSDRVTKASHKITIRLADSGRDVTVDSASDVNNMLLAYALTVHKAQGSEWRRVFFVTHQSHRTMLQRELLYTAITRAREELYVICEKDMFVKGVQSQKIKGNTLVEKAEYFKGKVERES